MRHLSVLAAGLLTSTMLTGFCVAAEENGPTNPAQVEQSSAPADQAPANQAPADQTAVNQTAANQTSADQTPADQAAVDQADPTATREAQSTEASPSTQSQPDTVAQTDDHAAVNGDGVARGQAEANGQAEMSKSDAAPVQDAVQTEPKTDETAQAGKTADSDDADDDDDDDNAVQTVAAESGSDQAQQKMTQPQSTTATQPSQGNAPTSTAPVSQASAAPNTQESAEDKAADKDFGRLSDDGASAFADIHFARLAIFDGNIDEAAKLISDAKESLNRAANDNTAFMKAETELSGPSEPSQQASGTQQKDKAKTAWLPIDGQLVIGETYKPTSQNAAAVVSARKSLRKGQGDEALKAIRMAAIDVDYTMALAPLQQSIAEVSMADQMMGNHDYYAALQALKQAEDGVRYDEIDDVAHVKQAAANGAAKTDGTANANANGTGNANGGTGSNATGSNNTNGNANTKG